MSSRSLQLLITASLLFTIACSQEAPPTADAEVATAQPPATTNAPPAAAPSDAPFAPISSRDTGAQPPVPAGAQDPGTGREIQAPGATFLMPADWLREQPSSSMRLAQARIPGSGGEAQLTAFYFGPGGGGGVEANLERWVGQVEPDAGTEPTRDSWSTDQVRITWVEVAGTLLPSTMGTGPSSPEPNSRLLGAVVEGFGGPWFFKATGPSTTLDEQREAFIDLLKSVRIDG